MAKGINIVSDRYAFSGIAFSAAKVCYSASRSIATYSAYKGLDYEWCKAPDVGLLSPDLVLFLNVSPEVAQQRGGFGAERYETTKLQAAVREQFANIGRDFGNHSSAAWHEIDANQSQDVVTSGINKIALQSVTGERTEQMRWSLWQ